MSALPSPGDRVRMVGVMPNDPCPIEVGTEGTVTGLGPDTSHWHMTQQIYVDWDNGRTLILLATDPYEIL